MRYSWFFINTVIDWWRCVSFWLSYSLILAFNWLSVINLSTVVSLMALVVGCVTSNKHAAIYGCVSSRVYSSVFIFIIIMNSPFLWPALLLATEETGTHDSSCIFRLLSGSKNIMTGYATLWKCIFFVKIYNNIRTLSMTFTTGWIFFVFENQTSLTDDCLVVLACCRTYWRQNWRSKWKDRRM